MRWSPEKFLALLQRQDRRGARETSTYKVLHDLSRYVDEASLPSQQTVWRWSKPGSRGPDYWLIPLIAASLGVKSSALMETVRLKKRLPKVNKRR